MNHADLENFVNNRSALPRTTTLFREPSLRTLLVHLNAGETMPEHQTRGAITVHCLAGHAILGIAGDRIELRPGVLIGLPAAAPHSVIAAEKEDVLLLVAIAELAATGE